MVYENKIPQTETIYELKENYEIRTSKLSPIARSKIIKMSGGNYVSERAFTNDISLPVMYGPGFWDDIKSVVKPIASGALVVASVFPPTAAIAAPIALGVIGTGATVMGVGHVTGNTELKEFGRDIVEIGANGREWQDMTETPVGVGQPSLNEYARSRR